MAVATLRFYEELNDFLPPSRRKRDITLAFDAPAPARHLIETLGVPHTEVELLLRNGESVDLEAVVADGDRLAVYPLFESLDITPLLRIRPRPLRRPRFLADAHLGRLAGYLRMLGFDTLDGGRADDRELARRAAREERILLTRDRALLMRREVTHGCYIRSRVPREQLAGLVRRLDLCRSIAPFRRCIRCNGVLEPVAKEMVVKRLPASVARCCHEFRRCPACGRVYWKGSHHRRMREMIRHLCPSAAE